MYVKLKKQDFRRKRRADGKTLVTAREIRHASTEEVIVKLVKEVAKDYPDKAFIIEHDGIIKFTVKCDDQILYTGDHYELEDMLAQGTYVFSELLAKQMK